MRLMTWNCRVGKFREKARQIEPLRPDVIAVQEVEPLEKVALFSGGSQPTFRHRLPHPIFPRRGIGVFSYTGLEITAVDLDDPVYEFRRFVARSGRWSFHVVAVWTSGTKDAKTSYRQAHAGLVRFADWISERPTVILGDFNANASFRGTVWPDLEKQFTALGMVSAYHHFYSERFGSESRPTHFHRGKPGAGFHLDYCLIPADWTKYLQRVEVCAFQDWREISDHVPIIVDLALQPTPSSTSEQWTCFEADAPSGWDAEDFAQFAESVTWTVARTMPENPHEYIVRARVDSDTFDCAVRFIRERGRMEVFAEMPYKVLYLGDRKYWTMGAPLSGTVIVNRKAAEIE
jgi:exonuclease III